MRKNGSDALRGMLDLEKLLDYELRSSTRHRRFVSLVMLSGRRDERMELRDLLDETIRDSDEVFYLQDATAILMGDTEESEAMTAVQRFRDANGTQDTDIRYGLSFFPTDGLCASELLSTAYRRLKEAQKLENSSRADQD